MIEGVHEALLDCILQPTLPLPPHAHLRGMARTIYENRDWSLMLILADALAEMGQDFLADHCRQPHHARGCCVLDSILGLRKNA